MLESSLNHCYAKRARYIRKVCHICFLHYNASINYIYWQEWNDELAKVAQDYADKCVWGENSERNSQQTAFAEVGENIGLRTGSSSDCVSLVDGWDREKYYYTYATGKCSSICDQYTQVSFVKYHVLWWNIFECN